LTSLVDTSVLLNLDRERDPESFRRFLRGREIALSTITIAEVLFGAHTPKVDEAERRRTRRMLTMVRRRAVIVPVDGRVAGVLAELWAKLDARRFTPSPFDLVIASTAVNRGLELLTSETLSERKRNTFRAVAEIAPLRLVPYTPVRKDAREDGVE
jgi:predicted nucleic acid-binding protein